MVVGTFEQDAVRKPVPYPEVNAHRGYRIGKDPLVMGCQFVLHLSDLIKKACREDRPFPIVFIRRFTSQMLFFAKATTRYVLYYFSYRASKFINFFQFSKKMCTISNLLIPGLQNTQRSNRHDQVSIGILFTSNECLSNYCLAIV